MHETRIASNEREGIDMHKMQTVVLGWLDGLTTLLLALVAHFSLPKAETLLHALEACERAWGRAGDMIQVAPHVTVYRGLAAARRAGRLMQMSMAATGMPAMMGGAGGHQALMDGALAKMIQSPIAMDNETVNGLSVDMLGWDFVDVLILVGAIDIAATCNLEDSADDSTFADISGAAIADLGASDDDAMVIISLAHAEGGYNRYVRAPMIVADGTAGAVIGAVAIRYGASGGAASRTPVTQDSTTTISRV